MAKFQFSLQGQRAGKDLSLSNVDLGLLSEFAKQVQAFLKGEDNSNLDQVEIELKSGSTMFQVTTPEDIFGSLMQDIDYLAENEDLSGIDHKRAKIILKDWQGSRAVRDGLRSYGLKRVVAEREPSKPKTGVTISKSSTYRLPQILVDVELYLRGQIENMGGVSDPNIHITLDGGDSLIINAGRDLLREEEYNPLYKDRLIRVRAKKNTQTQRLEGAEVVSFEPSQNKKPKPGKPDKYEQLAEKGAALAWKNVPNASEWVERVRGNLD